MAVRRPAMSVREGLVWQLRGLSNLGREGGGGSIGVEGLLYRLPDGVMSCGGMLRGSKSAHRGESSSIVRGPLSAEEIEGMVVQGLWNTSVSGHGVLNGCWGMDVCHCLGVFEVVEQGVFTDRAKIPDVDADIDHASLVRPGSVDMAVQQDGSIVRELLIKGSMIMLVAGIGKMGEPHGGVADADEMVYQDLTEAQLFPFCIGVLGVVISTDKDLVAVQAR